jgi:nucleotide-binding universal stress UspA family protein
MFEKILIAHDGSDAADRALDTAIEMASRFSAELHMISVEEDLPQYARTIDDVNQEKEAEDSYFVLLGTRSKQRARMRGVNLNHVIVAGHAMQSIAEFARDRRFELLVIGFTGHSRLYDHLWGGSSQNRTRTAPCTVLVVK